MDERLNNDDFEFIEILNRGAEAVNLLRFEFVGGISLQFPTAVIEPNEYVVIVKDKQAFAIRYGSSPRVIGEYNNDNLSNAGERVELVDPSGRTVLNFEYDDSGAWPLKADGEGRTLELSNALDVAIQDLGSALVWQSSQSLGGSPGRAADVLGDSNHDGVFDALDLSMVVQAGKYRMNMPATWEEGDWDGDGFFSTADIILALVEDRFRL